MNTNNYILITDSTCDLPIEILEENKVKLISLTYNLDGKEYTEGIDGLKFDEFYSLLRSNKMSSTSQVTPLTFENEFEKYLKDGLDLLYIGFSSGLSGTFNSAKIAAETMREKYPERKLLLVDSLAASLGEGLLVYKAIELYNQNKTIDEVFEWLEENKLHLCHLFTVDDLMFLHRGGRVSKTSAIAGSILGIKPLLHVDNDGKLIPISKIRGRKASIDWLVKGMKSRVGDFDNTVFAICHGDCIDDAKYLEAEVKKAFGIKNSIIRHTGAVIGAHSGPGTLALFFLGKER